MTCIACPHLPCPDWNYIYWRYDLSSAWSNAAPPPPCTSPQGFTREVEGVGRISSPESRMIKGNQGWRRSRRFMPGLNRPDLKLEADRGPRRMRFRAQIQAPRLIRSAKSASKSYRKCPRRLESTLQTSKLQSCHVSMTSIELSHGDDAKHLSIDRHAGSQRWPRNCGKERLEESERDGQIFTCLEFGP